MPKNPKPNRRTMRSNFEVEEASVDEQVPFTSVPSGGGEDGADKEKKPVRPDEEATAAATTAAGASTTIEIDPVILEAITKYAKKVPHPQHPDEDTRTMMLQVSPGVLVSSLFFVLYGTVCHGIERNSVATFDLSGFYFYYVFCINTNKASLCIHAWFPTAIVRRWDLYDRRQGELLSYGFLLVANRWQHFD